MRQNRLIQDLNHKKLIANISHQDSVAMSHALVDGGIDFMCIDMQDEEGVMKLEQVCQSHQDIDRVYIGASGCSDVYMVHDAVKAGAEWIISSHVDEAMIAYCHRHGIVLIPSIQSSQEAVSALEKGCDIMRFFPDVLEQDDVITAYKSYFPHLKLVLKSGVGPHNLKYWLKQGAFALQLGDHAEPFSSYDLTFENAKTLVEIVELWQKNDGS